MTPEQLWTDYAVWMHEYVVAAVDERSDRPEVAARLLRTPVDLGHAIEKAHTRKEGRRVAKALKQHVLMAIDYVDAVCAGDPQRFHEIENVWREATAPEAWHTHVPIIIALVTARLEENFDRAVDTFDELLRCAA